MQSLRSTSQKTPMWQFAPALSRSLACCFSPNDAYVLLSLANAHMYLWCLRDNAVEKEFAVALASGRKP